MWAQELASEGCGTAMTWMRRAAESGPLGLQVCSEFAPSACFSMFQHVARWFQDALGSRVFSDLVSLVGTGLSDSSG